jgi:nitrite reductase (NADH) large subunit
LLPLCFRGVNTPRSRWRSARAAPAPKHVRNVTATVVQHRGSGQEIVAQEDRPMYRSDPSSAGIAIIGGGIAGQSLAEELRARDAAVGITLICGEPVAPYDRVRLSELLVGDAGIDALALRPAEWYEDAHVEVLYDAWVTTLDPETASVGFADGTRRRFDAVALATGSDPLMPPLPGIDLEGVLPYRGPEDCDALRALAAPGVRVVVIGGGLLGLEAARGAGARGADVTVVHLVDRLMERQLDGPAAELLQDAMHDLDVTILLERQTTALLRGDDGRVSGLRFADGTTLAADAVVISIGIRPNVDLARSCGLAVERGVVVDDHLRTSVPAVVAVGECAEHRGTCYGLVAPVYEQARVAADTLLDRAGEPYTGSLQWAKLKVAGIDLVAIGAAEGERAAVSADRPAGSYRKLVVDGGRATGAILLGDTRGAEDLLNAIRTQEEVTDPLGRLAAAASLTAADLPDGAQICNCNGVCKGDIVRAVVEGGCATSREVMATTRAGAGCGSCRPMVKEILRDVTGGAGDEPAWLCPCRQQSREQIAAEIRSLGLASVSAVAAACGTGRECGACKPALAYLVSEINDNRHREERGARFINDRVHANIQNDGTFSVVPRMYGGVTSSDELRRIADAADKYDAKLVKVTGGQRIDLLGIRKSDLPDIWKDLGMPSGFAYAKAVRTVKSCVGTDFCRFGVGDAIAMAIAMEREWEHLHTPAKVKGGASGCPRNCAEATVKDIATVAVEGGWQIRVGGAAGATVREADILCTVATEAEALRIMTVFLQYYREQGHYLERVYDFVPRLGLEEIFTTICDAATAEALMERFRLAKAAAFDPWAVERELPYHPTQFVDVVGLGGEAVQLDDLTTTPTMEMHHE